MTSGYISNYSEAMIRIQLVTGCKTQKELADFLGVKQSSISDAKRRKSLPAEWLLKILRIKKINPDWIVYGTGEKYLKLEQQEEEVTRPASRIIIARRSLKECSTKELLEEISRRIMSL